jgi:hypothetical protein
MYWLKLGAAKWVSILLAPILSLIAFVVTYWIDPLDFSEQGALAAVPALLFSIVILLVGQAVTTIIEIQKTSEYSDKIYGAIKDYLHVTPVGSPEEALRYIKTRLPSIREANNTSFNIEGDSDRADEKFYCTNTYEETAGLIALLCKGSLLWKDIGDRTGLQRFRDLSSKTNAFAQASSSGYRYKLLSNSAPQINFITLEYKDGSKEVLFNWDFRGIGADPIVLISRDNHIVEMFSKHFNMLWRTSVIDHDNQPTKSIETK